jgi:hypothetical protein
MKDTEIYRVLGGMVPKKILTTSNRTYRRMQRYEVYGPTGSENGKTEGSITMKRERRRRKKISVRVSVKKLLRNK